MRRSPLALTAGPAVAWEPSKPVEIVVAAGAGGASDQMARMMQAAIQKNNLMKQPMVVSLKGGASGAEALIYMKTGASNAATSHCRPLGAAPPTGHGALPAPASPENVRRVSIQPELPGPTKALTLPPMCIPAAPPACPKSSGSRTGIFPIDTGRCSWPCRSRWAR